MNRRQREIKKMLPRTYGCGVKCPAGLVCAYRFWDWAEILRHVDRHKASLRGSRNIARYYEVEPSYLHQIISESKGSKSVRTHSAIKPAVLIKMTEASNALMSKAIGTSTLLAKSNVIQVPASVSDDKPKSSPSSEYTLFIQIRICFNEFPLYFGWFHYFY